MRRLTLVCVALLAVATASYAGYWFYMAKAIARGLGPWQAAARAQGYDIDWRSAAVGGFPFAFRIDFTGVGIGASRPTPFRATSAAAVATASPLSPASWHITAPQGAAIDAPALLAGAYAATLRAGFAQGSAGTTITIDAQRIAGRGLADGYEAKSMTARLMLPPQPPTDHRDPALTLTASLDGSVLPPGLHVKRIDALTLALTLRGAVPPGPLAPGLAQWRDDGGTLDLDEAHVAMGGTTIDLNGTFALDQSMQPEGAMTASIAGADKAVDQVVEAGGLAARYAGIIKSVLRAIASPDGKGGDAIRLPLTLQDQRLYVGPAMVAVLPRVTWR